MSSHSSGDRAIVIGGSIAGLLAARVLADRFDRVTIIERDRYPEEPKPRPGVPQSDQGHVLLSQGQRILEQLFPGLTASLTEKGALKIDWIADVALLLNVSDVWAPRFLSGITTCLCSRNLLELTIRKHLGNFSQVKFLQAGSVTELLTNSEKTTVEGVRVKVAGEGQIELPAQLVVDASGRNSVAPRWLKALGYEIPQETKINSFLGYATRLYERPQVGAEDWKFLYVMPSAPDYRRGGGIAAIEGECWIVTLMGVGKDYPPTKETGFLDFARSLRSSVLYQAITNAQPISPIYGYRNTENRLRHYEKLERMPENLVILGDAVCSFNPVYGQGMTVAALDALTLDSCLEQQQQSRGKENFYGLSRRFQQQIAKVNKTPWMMATGDDLRWSTTVGAKPDLITRLMQKYLDQVINAAVENNTVYKAFSEVMNMLKPPTALFAPHILLKVWQHKLKNTLTRKTIDDNLIHHVPQMGSTEL